MADGGSGGAGMAKRYKEPVKVPQNTISEHCTGGGAGGGRVLLMRVCSCASAFFHDDRINALKSSLKQLQVQFDNQRILLQQKDEELRKDKAEYRRLQAEGGGALSPGSPQHGRLGHSPPGSPRELDAMGRKELLHMQQARRP